MKSTNPFFRVWFTWLAVLAACLNASSSPALAQDYVGVLPEFLKPEVGQRLQLTEEQTAKMRALITQRTGAAVGLSQQLRDTPPDQHKEIRAQFNAESEKLGFALLNADQVEEAKKVRVGWLGMLSLEDPRISKELNLADWQQAKVQEQLSKVRSNRRDPLYTKSRDTAERAIRAELSESQWAAWQVQAGQIAASDKGPPMPPDRVKEAALAAGALPATDVAKNSEMPLEQVRLEMNFQGEPWDGVLKWLAKQADMALQSDVIPPGSFSYRDKSRSY